MSKSQGYGKPWREAIEVVRSPTSSGGLLASYQGEKKRTSHTVCTQTTKWLACMAGRDYCSGAEPRMLLLPCFCLLVISQSSIPGNGNR